MVSVIVIVLLTLFAGAGWYLFYRSVNVMFNFDQLFGEVTDVLQRYAVDLAKMSKGDLLIDHPEVRAFHKRNLVALEEINAVLEEVKKGRHEGPKELSPRPDVE